MEEIRNNNRTLILENTKFIFATNFAGKPDDKYGSTTRYGNVFISKEMADELSEEGFSVRTTTPREGEEEGFVPRYFTKIILNYNSDIAKDRPPKVCLVSGSNPPRELDAETVGIIDNTYVTNVNATVEKTYLKKYDKHVLYIRTMYVEQDVEDDPFASRYSQVKQAAGPVDEEPLPFD